MGEAFLLELTVGFIITNFLCMIPIRFGYYANRVGLVVFSVLLGWGVAKLVLSNCWEYIRLLMGRFGRILLILLEIMIHPY